MHGSYTGSEEAEVADHLTAQADLRAKVVGNLIYPAVLVVVGAGALLAIFGILIPMLRPMFSKMELGTLTKAVLGASDLVRGYGPVLVSKRFQSIEQNLARDDVQLCRGNTIGNSGHVVSPSADRRAGDPNGDSSATIGGPPVPPLGLLVDHARQHLFGFGRR